METQRHESPWSCEIQSPPVVEPSHAKALNAVFSASRAELAKARRIVTAFEKARAKGKERARVDGALVEVPIYAAAKRLLESAGQSSPPQRKKAG